MCMTDPYRQGDAVSEARRRADVETEQKHAKFAVGQVVMFERSGKKRPLAVSVLDVESDGDSFFYVIDSKNALHEAMLRKLTLKESGYSNAHDGMLRALKLAEAEFESVRRHILSGEAGDLRGAVNICRNTSESIREQIKAAEEQ